MSVELHGTPFEPWKELQRFEAEVLSDRAGSFGAATVFTGTMRDFNDGHREIGAMLLEHYPGMTEKHLEKISAEAKSRWEIVESLIIHRYGKMSPNEPIVLVAVWSAHRGEAFAACRFLIEELKSRAPFWKKESLQDRERWVEHNTPA